MLFILLVTGDFSAWTTHGWPLDGHPGWPLDGRGFADNAKKMPVKVKKQLDPTAELIRQLQEENAKLQAQLQSMGSEERCKLWVGAFWGLKKSVYGASHV